MEVQILLKGLQVDHAELAHIFRSVDLVLLHHFAGALDHARHARLADEHVVRLFGEHEAAGARERIEARLGQRAELELAVAIGEEGEHVEREPVRGRLVERSQDARIVAVTRAARQQCFRFLAAVAPEIAVEQVNHGPEVASLFDVHLENVAKVVERWARHAKHALLFDGGGLCVALRHDDAAQRGAIFARHFLPRGRALVRSEVHLALHVARLKEDTPAILGHAYVPELRPAIGLDADRRAQINLVRVALVRAHVVPPAQISGLPVLQGPLKDTVPAQIDVIWNLVGVINHRVLLRPIPRPVLTKLVPS